MKETVFLFFIKLAIYLSIVFSPIYMPVLWIGFFVFIDLMLALYLAKKKGEKITSKKMSNTVTKFLLYALTVICAHVIDTQFLNIDWLPAKTSQLAAGYIAIIEFKSILEKIESLNGLPLLKYLLQKFKRQDNEKETNN